MSSSTIRVGIGANPTVKIGLNAGAIVTGQQIVMIETPAGPVSGSNPNFSTAHNFQPGSLVVQLNGLTQNPGETNDYVETGSHNFQFNAPPLPGEVVSVSYIKS